MGVVAEKLSDDKGLVWPESIAPYTVYMVQIGNSEDINQQSLDLYNDLNSQGVEVFWDDRDARPGEKFADADLMGIPYRVVVSEKNIESRKFELKKRTENESRLVTKNELFTILATNNN